MRLLDSDSRGLEKPRCTEWCKSVSACPGPGAGSFQYQAAEMPLPLPTQGQDTAEHPGLRIAPSPISELISHLNTRSYHTNMS